MNAFEIFKELYDLINAPNIIICLAGILLFVGWLLRTSLGRNALADSMPRRNNMPPFLPFVPLFIWFGAVSLAVSITGKLLSDLPDWQRAFWNNFALCIGAIVTAVVVIFLVRASFARRLKGFGLNPKTIHKDFFAAVVNLLTVWPLVVAMTILTVFFGKLIWGQGFEMQPHEELKTIIAHPQLPVRVMIAVVAIVIAPVAEEMLFRGLFQTMLRSFSGRPWLSIAMCSILFATVHKNVGHWPALFMLSVCMGYAYERSGSLFRPIFIHSFFNGASIISVLWSA